MKYNKVKGLLRLICHNPSRALFLARQIFLPLATKENENNGATLNGKKAMNASFLNKGEVEKVMTSHSFKLTPSFSKEQFFNNYQHELLSIMGAVEEEFFHFVRY